MHRPPHEPHSRVIDDVTAMESCGEEIGASITHAGMFALIGPMGAGKTHFAKGFARGLGYTGEVSSPTFSLVHEYRGGRWPMFHFDFYRMQSAEEIVAIGWDDYVDQHGIMLVEWADLFPELWPAATMEICIEPRESARIVQYGKKC